MDCVNYALGSGGKVGVDNGQPFLNSQEGREFERHDTVRVLPSGSRVVVAPLDTEE